MSSDALSEFRTALADGNLQRSVELIDPVDDAIDRQAEREQAFRAVARGVLARSQAGTEANQTAKQFVHVVDGADKTRLEFGYYLVALVEGTADPTDLLDVTDTLIERRNAVQSQADQLRTQAEDVPLPPLLAVFGPQSRDVPKGSAIELDITVENAGTQVIKDIDVSVKTELDLAASPSQFDTLAAGATKTITISGNASSEGSHEVVVTVGTGDVDESHRITLVIADKGDYLSRAREQVQELIARVEDLTDDTTSGNNGKANNNGGNNGNSNGGKGQQGGNGVKGLLNKLRTVETRLESLAKRAERGKPNETALNNQITSVINQLGAVINQLDALGGTRIPEKTGAVLEHDTSEIITTLDEARTADI